MDGIKKYYGIIGAVTINASAIVYVMRMDFIGLIVLLVGNIIGQVLFKEVIKNEIKTHQKH